MHTNDSNEHMIPERIELDDRDRRLAHQMWEELDFKSSLKECEDAVQIVKECRHHGIDPASVLGPGMQTFIRLEEAHLADEHKPRSI